jgi:hypothetical protein
MRFLSQLLLISSCVFQHTFAKPKLPNDPVLLPINDPFYVPDNPKWESEPRGTILDKREVTIASLIPGAESEAKAYQLLYVTQDLNENPQATIIVPKKLRMNRVISLQNAYDSLTPTAPLHTDCSMGPKGGAKSGTSSTLPSCFPISREAPSSISQTTRATMRPLLWALKVPTRLWIQFARRRHHQRLLALRKAQTI